MRELHSCNVPAPQFSNESKPKSQVHRRRTDITSVSDPHRVLLVSLQARAWQVKSDRGIRLSSLQHCGNSPAIVLQQLDSQCIVTLSLMKNSEDSKEIKRVGEQMKGAQRTKAVTLSWVMMTSVKDTMFRVSQVLLTVPSGLFTSCIPINAKYNMKMPHGIDSIYMGYHILSSVSCVNSELTDFVVCPTSSSLHVVVLPSSST